MKVVIVGGGIGGLALAHGLRRAGVEVEVLERDAGGRTSGFRIHLNPAGSRALHALLPSPLWAELVATAGPGGEMGLLTEQLDELVVVEESTMYPGRVAGPAEDHYAVDRAVLRAALLSDTDVRFGAEFVRYEPEPDGRVAAVLADGDRVVGDLLVGADGTASRVRRQLLPGAEPVDAGVVGMAGKLPLTAETRRWLPARLQRGMNAIVVEGPMAMFLSVFDPPRGAAPYLMCALLATPDVLPPDVTSLRPEALGHLVAGLTARWHPDLRRMLAEVEPASRNALRFTAAPDVPDWRSGNVTLLGDAIHTMPPTGGLGGNTALRDAWLLTQVLTGDGDLARYEREMRAYGTAAVRAALAGRAEMLGGGPLTTMAARTFLRLCSRLPALRRRSFGDFDAPARPLAWERPAA